jgi:hypothetical protein
MVDAHPKKLPAAWKLSFRLPSDTPGIWLAICQLVTCLSLASNFSSGQITAV